MNEHIRKMAEEYFDVRDDVIVSPVDGYVDIEEELQKFAELIIKECLNVVKEVRDDCWSELSTEIVREYMKAQSDDTMIAIKRHFGIE